MKVELISKIFLDFSLVFFSPVKVFSIEMVLTLIQNRRKIQPDDRDDFGSSCIKLNMMEWTKNI